MQGIYEIINLLNGDSYVGRSNNIAQRWEGHVSELRKGRHSNRNLQEAWDEFSEGTFSFCVLERVENEEDLQQREQYYLDRAFEVGGTYNVAGNATAYRQRSEMSNEDRGRYLKLAHRIFARYGGYNQAAIRLGNSSLRANLWRFLNEDGFRPSDHFLDTLQKWNEDDHKPLVLEKTTEFRFPHGSIIVDEEGLLDCGQPICLYIFPRGEVESYLAICKKCGQQMIKYSPGQKCCTACRKKAQPHTERLSSDGQKRAETSGLQTRSVIRRIPNVCPGACR